MIAEIAVVPQAEGPSREVVHAAIDAIAGQGLRYQVTPTGTCVEGELDEILDAVRAVDAQLEHEGVARALVEVRLQREPHPETLEHQVAGLAAAAADPAGDPAWPSTPLGLTEQELRSGLEEELVRAMRSEGGKPTIHAIAHSVARIIEQDHLRMAEQLERSGVTLGEPVE